jgi:Tol biopolymer transport system component
MTPDRDADIERICHAALACDVAARAAFLEEACAGNLVLRLEVESLLAQESAAAGFMSTPAVALAGSMTADARSWIGRKLGPYVSHALLGVGGMGQVYQAHDTNLERDVAIKILPEAFAHDPDRLTRFQREARMLAALNHPTIAAIYGFEQSNGTSYLVMELVSGETLQQRLARKGRLPIEDALGICRQIAEALEAAHEKGIIHRDLKPANVKVTPEGKIKVLDFGLAKALAGDGMNDDPSHSPTLSRAATAQGVILGTAAYMSPEQARSQAVDTRTDMWAFGCMLYELLTGKQAFQGDTVTEILAGVLRGEPDWSALPAATPTTVRALLRRCLQKDKTARMRDAADARIEIQEALATPPSVGPAVAGPAKRGWRLAALFGLTAVAVAVTAEFGGWNLKHTAPSTPRPVVRFTITLPPGQQLAGLLQGPAVALSPDGTRLAYVAMQGGPQQLYLRTMDSLEARPVPGTEGAVEPFFSPDGQRLGFFAGGQLKTVSVNGAAAFRVGDAARNPLGASWGGQGTIAFVPTLPSAVQQVSDAGGGPESLTRLEKGEIHAWPEFLPGGKVVLFVTGTVSRGVQIAVQDRTRDRRNLIPGGTQPHYIPSGHLVYGQFVVGGLVEPLMAVPFDTGRLAVTGMPVPVIEGVLQSPSTAGAHYSVSATGSLVYVTGGGYAAPTSLVWVDRKGVEQVLAEPAHVYTSPKLSPDGQRAAVTIGGPEMNVYTDDLARNTSTRLTFQGFANSTPTWMPPDGKRIAFASNTDGHINLFWQWADGSGGLERLTTSEHSQTPSSWSPDGHLLAFSENDPTTGNDIWVVRVNDHKVQLFLRTPFSETAPQFSPDGRWLAYVSDESGRFEIYVQPYPGPGAKRQISADGGAEPVWNPNGHELFYRSGSKMMAVDIATRTGFVAGNPRMLFDDGRYLLATSPALRDYDVSPDGQRFLMLKYADQAQAPTQINVVLNWSEELKQKVPAGPQK